MGNRTVLVTVKLPEGWKLAQYYLRPAKPLEFLLRDEQNVVRAGEHGVTGLNVIVAPITKQVLEQWEKGSIK